MILAFAEDSTVTALDNFAEVQTHCEFQDVEAGIYTFCDKFGRVLRPVIPEPNRHKILGFAFTSSPAHFTLASTDERRPDLLQSIIDGQVFVSPGPRIQTREELVKELRS
jgi:hypothetical protein